MDSGDITRKINELEHKIMMFNRELEQIKRSIRIDKEDNVGYSPQNSKFKNGF